MPYNTSHKQKLFKPLYNLNSEISTVKLIINDDPDLLFQQNVNLSNIVHEFTTKTPKDFENILLQST